MQSKTFQRYPTILSVCLCLMSTLILRQSPINAALANGGVAGGGCTHDIECDDGLPCTLDICNFPSGGPAGAGTCQHAPVPDGQPGGFGGPECAVQFGLLCGGCDDRLFCDGAETCQGGACVAGTPPCSGPQVCSESLRRCQPGPCSSQKTCMGGPTPGAACTTNFNCGNGGLCRYADCEDGLLCNGEETCVAGVCQAGDNPCGPGAICGERQCSNGPNIDICLTNEDCYNGLGTCSLMGPVCVRGRCCSNGTEPACSVRYLRGFCSGSTAGTNAGAACSTGSECHTNVCNQYAASCNGLGGQFYATDDGGVSPCRSGCDYSCAVECPKYASGIAPRGPVLGFAGPISDSDIMNPSAGTPIHKLGDDYRFTNTGVCVGGTRNGLGCADNSACRGGGVCNLAGPSVMSISYLRLVGGATETARAGIEFRDAAGRFVGERYGAYVNTIAGLQILYLDPPITVPSKGFVVLRVGSEYTPNSRFVWASTDAVDVGFNDPSVLWVNDGPASNFLAPNPGILIFELEGEKMAAPLGACCNAAGPGCTNAVLPWVCEGDGNHFQGVGSTCPAPACDTGACCNPSTGTCTVGTETNCVTASGVFQGFGTDCDADHGYDAGMQQCCPQPFTAADRCEDAIVHSVAVPPPGSAPVVVTISGDNSPATFQTADYCCSDDCYPDFGWWEAFEIDQYAFVRIDFCCSEPVRRLFHRALFDCPCGSSILSAANPYRFPEANYGLGSPYCDDGNPWANFGPLAPGRYYYPIFSTADGLHGPYQLHLTVEALPTAACCVADQCTDGVNQLQCDALGGVFLGPPQKAPLVPDCSTNPCATGSCCPGPGSCFDNNLGQPVDKAYCDSQGGTYHGGLRCQGGSCSGAPADSCSVNADCPNNGPCLGTAQQLSQPLPCPICPFAGPSNCQTYEDTLNFAISDRHVGISGALVADDFKPAGDTLSKVCVWGFTLDSDPNAETAECTWSGVKDHFRVRVYNNDSASGRVPGTLKGQSTASSERGVNGPSRVETLIDPATYGYQLTLDAPITGLTPGAVYWLEVSNDVSDPFGNQFDSCIWFWMQKNPNSNTYSYTGTNAGYMAGFEAPFDMAFCTNFNITASTLGAIPGPCCTCDGQCSLRTLVDCDYTNGVWDVTRTSCDGATCPIGPPPNDNCVDGPLTITEGSYTASNQCATTDGFGPIPDDSMSFQIDFDLWYRFIAPRACDLIIGECQTGLRFDSNLVVYHSPNDPTTCPPCPLDAATSTATLAGTFQDESCTMSLVGGAGRWQASQQIGRNTIPGECFLIRVGSFPGNRGTAILDVYCSEVYCIPHYRPICEPYFIESSRFLPIGCDLFHPCANQIPVEGAIRVHLTSLHHVNPPYTGGPSIPFTSFEGQVRWVGTPSQYIESTANPIPFWAARLQCTPHYQDWSTVPLLYVTGPEIVPSSTYQYELLKMSCQGSEETCTDVSPTTTIHTTRWGDVETPYNPPDPATQPDFADVSALVNKFKSLPGAPTKGRALLAGTDAFGNINLVNDLDFSHIAVCVDAFQGKPYPYTISSCP